MVKSKINVSLKTCLFNESSCVESSHEKCLRDQICSIRDENYVVRRNFYSSLKC